MDRLVTAQALIRCPPDVERLCLLLCTHRSCASHNQGHGVSHVCAINSYVSRYARVFAYRVNLATRRMGSISENAGHQQFGVCDHGVRVTSPTPRHADKTTHGIIGSMPWLRVSTQTCGLPLASHTPNRAQHPCPTTHQAHPGLKQLRIRPRQRHRWRPAGVQQAQRHCTCVPPTCIPPT